MNSTHRSTLVALIASLLIMPVSATPVVIHDAGADKTQSMEKYMRIFHKPAQFTLPDDPVAQARLKKNLLARAAKHGGPGSVRVPIRTANMRPEKTSTRDAFFPNLSIPLFIVGADPASLNWLRHWRDALVKSGAVGWVVQAETEEELKAIAEAAAGLRLLAMSGESLPTIFGVETYPVLISERAIEQ